MKRIAYSILIGAGCAFLFFGLSKLRENERKNKGRLSAVLKNGTSRPEISYSAQLLMAIGNPGDNIKLIERTRDQISYRLSGSYTNLSLDKIDKNIYALKADNISDTSVFKNAIIASGRIEFSELFSLTEISTSLMAIDSMLRTRDAAFSNQQKKLQEAKKNLDTTTDKLSDVLDPSEFEKSQAKAGLAKFISFASPYKNTDGSLRCLAELGSVKTKDTSLLNQIFNDPAFTGFFPENLKFIYGAMDIDLYPDDSILKIFAKKTLDRTLFPYPTGEQITEAIPQISPGTSQPVISFSLNSAGAQDW
jgi:preprotein translocase subunit SecD